MNPEHPSEPILALHARLPEQYHVVYDPETRRNYLGGPEVQDLIRIGLDRGMLVLPYAESPLKQALRATWKLICTEAQVPYVVVELNPEQGGQIHYDLSPMGIKLPRAAFELFQLELRQYLRSYHPAAGAGVPVLRGGQHQAVIGDIAGTLAFGPGRFDGVELVMGYVREIRNRTWLGQAPEAELPAELESLDGLEGLEPEEWDE